MTTYGPNFEVIRQPQSEQRGGRFAIDDTVTAGVPIGAPVVASANGENSLGLVQVEAATDAAAIVHGRAGVMIQEIVFLGTEQIGYDLVATTQADLSVAKVSSAVQVVSGTNIKFLYRNVYDEAESAAVIGTYAWATPHWRNGTTTRRMIADAELDALAPGDFLEPHDTPSDANGYWKVTANQADAWLVVTRVDLDGAEFDAQMQF